MFDQGRDPPAAFYDLDPPQVWPWLEYVWRAFHELSTERQIGMAVGPIPVSRIRAYGDDELELDCDSDQAERFFDLVRQMDEEYLSTSSKPDKVRAEVSPDDAAGVGLLFKKIENRNKQRQMRKERT